MKKRQITKLFAVMAIAASPAAAGPSPERDPWAHAASVSPLTPAQAVHAIAAAIEIGFATLERAREAALQPPVVAPPVVAPAAVVARPRTMRSGAPACGNVASRMARPKECVSRSAPSTHLADALTTEVK
ncbi:MAG: hypothetical protein H0T42_10000 [Deltaproteobacteria bacterium]|nr:hypothetical protein [Deltaproteobacteria bacterium]